MEIYSRDDVIALTQPIPNWMNFKEKVEYEKKSISLIQAVTELYTVLDDIEDFERVTFIEYARALKENRIVDIPKERLNKIQNLIRDKYIDLELMISCFKCEDLKRLLPEEYPKWIKVPNNSYVVEDRNHRLIALALRILDGEEIGDKEVIVFYGHLVK